jgi:hypothetical protein
VRAACQHDRVLHRSTRRVRTWPRVSIAPVRSSGIADCAVVVAHIGSCPRPCCNRTFWECSWLHAPLVIDRSIKTRSRPLEASNQGTSGPPTSLSATTVVTGATLCSLNNLRAVVARGQLRDFSVCSCWLSIVLTHSTTVQQPIPVIHTACVHNGARGDFNSPCPNRREGVISAQVRWCGRPSAERTRGCGVNAEFLCTE